MANNNSTNYVVTQYGLIVGGTNNNIVTVTPGTNSYRLIRSNGVAANPVAAISVNTDFTFESSNNGTNVYFEVLNPSTSGSAVSNQLLSVAGATADDPYRTYTVTGVTNFSTGIDNSDADKYKISASTTLGTSDCFVMFSTGEILQPLQPAFFASQGATIANVTGDGTVYTGRWDTEIFDQNNNYDNTTYTFTAPVTGFYCFQSNLCGNSFNNGTYTKAVFRLVTSNRTYVTSDYTATSLMDSNTYLQFLSFVLADLDAGDTAKLEFVVTGGTKQVAQAIFSTTFRFNFHSGALEV